MASQEIRLLIQHGPCLSTDLVDSLVKLGMPAEAARQRISRLRTAGGVNRLGHLPFPRRAKFLYLEQEFGSKRYWDALHKAIIQKSPSYGPALAAVLQRGGLLPLSHFSAACGAPLRQKKQLSADRIRERFVAANVLEEVSVPGVGPCLATGELIRSGDLDAASTTLRARIIVEDLLLNAISAWLRQLAFVSYEKVAVRALGKDGPRVGTFAWDLTGPSYLAPMLEWRGSVNRPKPGFVAVDVLTGVQVTIEGIQPFLRKCFTLRQLLRVGRCLQFFVADRYTAEALRAAKEIGVVPATIDTLFGRGVSSGLKQLAEVLANAASSVLSAETFDELFKKLGKIEGVAVNLRGALFELISAQLIRDQLTPDVWINRVLRDPRTSAESEVDVLAVTGKRVVHFIECKGYNPSGEIPHSDVKHWLSHKIPIFYRFAQDHPDWRGYKFQFEIWATGKFSEESLEMLGLAEGATKRYSIVHRDARAVYDFARAGKNRSLLKTLGEHFVDHPFATIEKATKARHAREQRKRGSGVARVE